jgi:hypothetical protein
MARTRPNQIVWGQRMRNRRNLDKAGVMAAVKAMGGYRGDILSNPRAFCERIIRAYLRTCQQEAASPKPATTPDGLRTLE